MKKSDVLRWGVTEGMDDESRRVTILSNVIYIITGTIIIFFLIVNIPRYIGPLPIMAFERWAPTGLLLIAALSLWLNRMHLRSLSKVLYLSAWIFVTTLAIPLLYGTTELSYISTAIYAILASILVHVLFSWMREKLAYLAFVIITWAIVLFFVELVSYSRLPGQENVLFVRGFSRWRLIIFMVAAFLTGVVIYITWLNHQMHEFLRWRNLTIEQQNRMLAEQREQLVALAMQLRQKVDTTHVQLSEQTQRLTEYTYFNSHILRAPVSRIRGLIQLLTLKIHPKEEAEVRELLAKSMQELDDAIREITEKLSTKTG